MSYTTGKVYLILEESGRGFQRLNVVSHRKSRPALAADQVAVKLEIRLPDDVFDMIADATVDVVEMIKPSAEVSVHGEDSDPGRPMGKGEGK